MSYPSLQPQTPQRPLPGAYLQTPAVSRYQTGVAPPRQPVFRSQSFTGQHGGSSSQNTVGTPQPHLQASESRQVAASLPLQPIQRAARTINEVLQKEASFPDLDSYVKRKSCGYGVNAELLTAMQRVSPPTMTSLHQSPSPPGRRSRGRRCMTYQTKSSSSIIARRSRR